MNCKMKLLILVACLQLNRTYTQTMPPRPPKITEAFDPLALLGRDSDVDKNDDDYVDAAPFDAQDISRAMNMDLGKFSTFPFDYFNNQFLNSYHERILPKTAQCFDEYFRCMANLAHPVMICALNDAYQIHLKSVWISYCDFYLDNCRHTARIWYMAGPGMCSRYVYIWPGFMPFESWVAIAPWHSKFSHYWEHNDY